MTSARVIALCNVLHIVLPNVDFIENKFDPVRCEEVNGASVDPYRLDLSKPKLNRGISIFSILEQARALTGLKIEIQQHLTSRGAKSGKN